jgi:hypothetical protein
MQEKMMNNKIFLEKYEFKMAAEVGLRRCLSCKTKGIKDKYGFKGYGWDISVEGACAELALAKYLGVYWNGSVDTFKNGGDVSGLEVRTTKNHNKLIVRKEDRHDSIYVLLTGKAPEYNIVGWEYGYMIKQSEYLTDFGKKDRPLVYAIPGKLLNDPKLLFSVLDIKKGEGDGKVGFKKSTNGE